MIYKVFPEGYDPRVASGPPDDFEKSIGIEWPPEETEKMRELAKQYILSSTRPTKRWFEYAPGTQEEKKILEENNGTWPL